MTTSESLIVKVLRSYFPDWKAPVDRGRDWISCLCPFHGDTRPSASVSYPNNAFRCFACGEKGDALAIIMRREGISHSKAIAHAEKLFPGSNAVVQQESARKPRRRVFGAGQEAPARGDQPVPPGVRRRTTPWS